MRKPHWVTFSIKSSVAVTLGCFAFLALPNRLLAQPTSEPLSNFWRTDGFVNAIAATNNLAYIGGDFTYIGPGNGAAGLLDSSTGLPVAGFPKLDGVVYAVLPDGLGGWYLGGQFTASDNSSIQNLVHVNASRALDLAFRPNPDGSVRALSLVGGNLLVGGEFFQIANSQLSYFAMLNPSSGKSDVVRFRINSPVKAMAVASDIVYLGGTFTSVNTFTNNNQQVANPRQRLAAIRPTTGEVLPWNPGSSGGSEGVKSIVVNGSTIYVGGDFTQVGSKPRNAIASLNDSDGTANNWNPNAQLSGGTPVINSLVIVGSVLYVGGDFTTIGAKPHLRLAAVQATGFGQATSWLADANDVINFIVPMPGDLLAVGGKFTVIGGKIDIVNNQQIQTGGTKRRGFAQIGQIAQSDGSAPVNAWGPQVSSLKPATQFNTQPNANSFALAAQGTQMLLAGDFVSFGGAGRDRLAAIDLRTGGATDWNPGADLTVRALALGRNGLYVGGNFTNIGGLSRPRIALVKYDTGQADAWDAGFAQGQYVSAIAPGRGTVFVGGQFNQIGGQSRQSLAEIDATTGFATDWNPQPGGQINALVFNDKQIYVGGNFFGISGGQQQYVALLTTNANQSQQLVKTFDAKADGQVRSLALTADNNLYVAGDFAKISGQDRKAVAAIDPATGQEINAWDAQISGGQVQVRSVLPLGVAVYVGGGFRVAGGENRGRIASVHSVFQAASAWDPGVDGAVSAIGRTDNIIIIGGEFTRLGLHGLNPNPNTDGQPVQYLAAFNARPAIRNFARNAAGHVTFDITDGDGLGSSLLIQASESLTTPNWLTLETRDILGIQDPFSETPPNTATRFYRLQRQP